MITESTIYWITRLDYLRHIISVPGLIIAILATFGFEVSMIIYLLAKGDDDDKVAKSAKKGMKYSAIFISVSIIAGFLWAFIPSTKEMCAIKIIPVIANNENVKELPNKAVELANEWMEELRPKKE